MNKERGQRFSRARLAAGTAVLFLAEACGGNVPATPGPTENPTLIPATSTPTVEITPMPTPTVMPTETVFVTPSPTIEVTPTPTKEATPAPLSVILTEFISDGEENGFPSTTASQVKADINSALEADPETANAIFVAGKTYSETLIYVLNMCETAEQSADKLDGCSGLGEQTYSAFLKNENEVWLSVLNSEIDYFKNTLTKSQWDYVINDLSNYNPSR